MRRLLIALCFWLAAVPAFAQVGQVPGFARLAVAPQVLTTFSGLVDQESTIRNCYAVKACGSAAAAAKAVAVDLCDNSSGCGSTGANTCIGVKVLSTGSLDVSTGTYCGAGGTSTVTTWCSTNCVFAGTARVTKFYDQVGSSPVSATYSLGPDFILSGFSSKPTFALKSSRSTQVTGTITALALTNGYSIGLTFEQNASFSTFSIMATAGGTSAMDPVHNSANTFEMLTNGGTSGTTTATDGSGTTDFTHCHAALVSVASSGSAANFYVDGTTHTGSSVTVTASATTIYWGSGNFSNYADIFSTAMWLDANSVTTTVGDAVTNLTTVPCGQ